MALPVDGEAIVRAAAAAYAAQTKPIVTFVAITELDVHGGPFHQHSFSETGYEETASTPVRRRILRDVESGKVLAADELAKRSAAPEAPTARFGMKLPIVAIDDYTYAKPRQDGDEVAVDFKTSVRDESHGDGTITLYPDGRIATIVTHPVVLPPHATSLTTTIEFARVFEDRWDIVKITDTFTGRQGIISGGGSSVTTYERYRPWPTQSAADAALDAMEPSTG
jgi:hypothetical protein